MKNRILSRIVLLLVVLVSFFTAKAFITETASASLTPKEKIAVAWELAQVSDRYTFHSTIHQTTYPAPKITNAGHAPRQDHLGVEGHLDQAEENMTMTLWRDTSFNPDTGIEIRVENGHTFARHKGGEWEEMDSVSDVFAPGGDPLGFLAGITNVQTAGTEERYFSETQTPLIFSRYTFDLDGPALALYVKTEMESQMLKTGEMLPGMQIDMPDVYLHATGSGEIFIDGDGLPVRLSLDIDFGEMDNGERVFAETTSDYSAYIFENLTAANSDLFADPGAWLKSNLTALARDRQNMIMNLSMGLLSISIVLLCLTFWRSKKLYSVIVISVIVSMVFTPLLRGQRVYAAAQQRETRQDKMDAQQAEVENQQKARATLTARDWDPHQGPVSSEQLAVNSRHYWK